MAINRLPTVFLLATRFLAGGDVAFGQNAPHPADSALTLQMHEALSLAQQGDRQAAMNTVEALLQQQREFAPAIKLKARLLEDSGHPSEAAAAYEQALRLPE